MQHIDKSKLVISTLDDDIPVVILRIVLVFGQDHGDFTCRR